MPDPDPQPTPNTDPAPASGAAPDPQPTTPDAPLGDGGKAALDAERKARKDAEKAARDAQARLKALEDAQLTEAERLKKDAEEGRAIAEQATAKLRQANLRDALAEEGFTGPQAKAVAKLLDSVEYDDGDEPTNLKRRLEAAAAEYGDLVKPGTSTTFDGGARTTAPPPQTPQQKHQEILRAALSGQLQTT